MIGPWTAPNPAPHSAPPSRSSPATLSSSSRGRGTSREPSARVPRPLPPPLPGSRSGAVRGEATTTCRAAPSRCSSDPAAAWTWRHAGRSCSQGVRSSSATRSTLTSSRMPHKCVIDVTLVPPPAQGMGTSGPSPAPVAGGGLCPPRHADSHRALLPCPPLGLRQTPCETPPRSPRIVAHSAPRQPFVTVGVSHISPCNVTLGAPASVTPTPCHTAPSLLRDTPP